MKKLAFLMTFLGLAIFSQSALANEYEPTILEQNYRHSNQHDCYIYNYSKENRNERYCMEEVFNKVVRVNGLERMYYVTVGKGVDSNTGEGINGFFIYELQDGRYRKIFSSHNEVGGNYYENKGVTDWKIKEFAPDVWGFYAISAGYAGGGFFSDNHVVSIPQQNKLQMSFLTNTYNNEGSIQCYEEENHCVDLESEFVIDRNQVVNQFYPINLIVYGKEGKKLYNHQVYQSIYVPNKGYVTPNNYPQSKFDE